MEYKCVEDRSLESERFVTCKISNEERWKDVAWFPIKQNNVFSYAPFETNSSNDALSFVKSNLLSYCKFISIFIIIKSANTVIITDWLPVIDYSIYAF